MKPSLLAAGALVFLSACSAQSSDEKSTASAAASPRAVTVGKVEMRRLTKSISLSGVLVSREEAAVSSQVVGYPVAQVFVDQDAEVGAGQPLAKLDDTLLRADIAQQQAVVEQQRVAAEKSRQEAARVAGLSGSGVLSQEAIAERQLAARAAVAALAQAQAQLHSLLVRRQLMTIRAPVAGRILERAVRPGDITSTSSVMFRIERGNLTELDAEVPEQVIANLHAGQSATVSLTTGRQFKGIIRLVSAEIDSKTKLGRARILLPVDHDLRPGGFASAALDIGTSDQPTVPETALRYDASGAHLMVLDNANRAHDRIVRIGTHASGRVALIDGLPLGTRVLTGGQSFVLDGDTVKPVAGR